MYVSDRSSSSSSSLVGEEEGAITEADTTRSHVGCCRDKMRLSRVCSGCEKANMKWQKKSLPAAVEDRLYIIFGYHAVCWDVENWTSQQQQANSLSPKKKQHTTFFNVHPRDNWDDDDDQKNSSFFASVSIVFLAMLNMNNNNITQASHPLSAKTVGTPKSSSHRFGFIRLTELENYFDDFSAKVSW